jgi:hypothetical protein
MYLGSRLRGYGYLPILLPFPRYIGKPRSRPPLAPLGTNERVTCRANVCTANEKALSPPLPPWPGILLTALLLLAPLFDDVIDALDFPAIAQLCG